MAEDEQRNESQGDVRFADNPGVVKATKPGIKLKFKFGTMAGDKTWTFGNANGAADEEDIKALAQAMITNGSIYRYPPLIAKEAWIETVTVTSYDLGG